jgi:succinate dehydrogenase / fumarate reductase cytochrome b subunit
MQQTKARPLSPHLQIYRFPLTAILSITHRISGVFLALGAAALSLTLAALAGGPVAYKGAAAFWGSPVGYLFLFLWTFALYYHLANGIRHLVWDAGYGFDKGAIARSGRLVVAASGGLAAFTWFVVLL